MGFCEASAEEDATERLLHLPYSWQRFRVISTPLGCRPLLPSMPVPAGCSGSSPCVYPHSAIGLSPICVSSEFVIVVFRLYLRPPIMMIMPPRKSGSRLP